MGDALSETCRSCGAAPGIHCDCLDDPPEHHFNGLKPEVAELLAILAEECGEVTQCIGKILRHGLRTNPYDPNGMDNADKLETELADIESIVHLLTLLRVINNGRIVQRIEPKLERLRRPGILHHSSILRPRPCRVCGSTTRIQWAPGENQSIVECVDRKACEAWKDYCDLSRELHEHVHDRPR
jgi:NTP pyrophosphatase (non-canonical NTP hydrolase)